jgi:hypothetical protein
MKKIYTKVKKKRTDTVVDFIAKNYTKYGFVTSYKNKECTKVECAQGRNRSLDAIYQVCLSKFPNLSLDTFYAAIATYILKSGKTRAMLLCDTIDRWVVYKIAPTSLSHNNLIYDYMSSKKKLHLYGKGELRAKEVVEKAATLNLE